MELEYSTYRLDFKFDAGTSRGIIRHRDIWLLELRGHCDSPVIGRGEVAPLPGLSHEPIEMIPDHLKQVQLKLRDLDSVKSEQDAFLIAEELSRDFPSVRFGLEMSLLDLYKGGKQRWYDNDWTNGITQLPINGLIWMNTAESMKQQADEKLEQGFDCIKMKIGAIDFEAELSVLNYIRSKFDGILRVDANGAFLTEEVFKKLNRLSDFKLHSIEQPIMPRQRPAMQLICQKSSIPVALDEELIGVWSKEDKCELLDEINPHYIILKPSLIGGFYESAEWIKVAEERQIGWWMTSALESNLGLNAITQFTANYTPQTAQGLGTGGLFKNNLTASTEIKSGKLLYAV
ncbi:MAG: o-succinylbenzoate synthase [Cyclobacteriaceae bacterium]